MTEKEKEMHFIGAMEDIERMKHCLIGIFMAFKILEPKFSPFLSKAEKVEIREQMEFLGKTIVHLTQDGMENGN